MSVILLTGPIFLFVVVFRFCSLFFCPLFIVLYYYFFVLRSLFSILCSLLFFSLFFFIFIGYLLFVLLSFVYCSLLSFHRSLRFVLCFLFFCFFVFCFFVFSSLFFVFCVSFLLLAIVIHHLACACLVILPLCLSDSLHEIYNVSKPSMLVTEVH